MGAHAKTPLHRSIATRLFALSFRYYVVVALALTGVLAAGEYLSARATLREELGTYERAFSSALAAALWTMEAGKLDAVAVGMVEIPEIVAVRITDPANGHVFTTAVAGVDGVHAGRDAKLDAAWQDLANDAALRHGFDIFYTHAVGSSLVGRAELLVGRQQLFDRIRGQTQLIVAISLFKEAVLWAIFLLVARRVLVRPLRHLIGALNETRPESPKAIVFPPASMPVIAGTELEVVRAAFNHLIDRVEEQRLQLVNANAALEEQVAERTSALEDANVSLRAQAQRLEASNAELEQFAYVASHDLRQPLRLVASYMSLLERNYGDRLDEDGHVFIGYARDGAARMDRLINDLLSLSRIGRTSHSFAPTPFADVVTQALKPLQEEVEAAGASLSVASDLPVVQGDGDELVRLVANLIGNAVKYRSPARTLEIAVGWRPAEGGDLLFWVRDNGLGIAPEHSERVFQIFQRVHAAAGCEGTGIGLAICKKIVERHGGRIWVDSAEDAGSTFFFTLKPAAD